MRILTCLLLLLGTICLRAQTITKYYDANWGETSKDKASFYAVFEKKESGYACTSYWARNNAVRGRSVYPDTVMAKPIGVQTLYYPNGSLEDSSLSDNAGNPIEAFHYHPNKKLAMHYLKKEGQKEPEVQGYDEAGERIKNYILVRDASFKGGDDAWRAYLAKHVTTDFAVKKASGEETVTVYIRFAIDEGGNITGAKVYKSSGLSYVDQDALRVVSNGPQWNNAIMYNKPIKVYRNQPITYVLSATKK
jgi:protein TonB